MPSESCRGIPTSAGIRAPILKPVLSVRYFPTVPDEFPSPLGWRADFEFSSNRVDSQQLAATTTDRHLTCFSVRVFLSIYDTALTFPSSSVISSRAIALVIRVTLPDFIAG